MKRQVFQSVVIFFLGMCVQGASVCFSADNDEKLAIVVGACAPWDGAAYTIWIPGGNVGGKRNSWIRISIWQAPNRSDTSFIYPDRTGKNGNATYLPDLKSHEKIVWSKQIFENLSGKLHLTRVNDHDPILGEFDLVTEKEGHLNGTFEAPWGNKSVPCG